MQAMGFKMQTVQSSNMRRHMVDSQLRTSGVSFYRIMVAPLMFGLFTSLVSFGLNEAVVPVANRTSKRLEFLALYKAELPAGQANFTYMERGKDLNIACNQLPGFAKKTFGYVCSCAGGISGNSDPVPETG